MRIQILLPLALVTSIFGCGHRELPTTSGPVPAASNPAGPVTSSADVVKARAVSVLLTPGSNADAFVTLTISPGYHVNANPATFSYLIPTEVTVEPSAGFSAGKPTYPVAEKKKFEFAAQPLAVYEGSAQIKIKLQTDAKVEKGSRTLPVTIRVQACDHEKCYAPATLNASLAVDVK